MTNRNFESGDSADLEALFDSIVSANTAKETPAPVVAEPAAPVAVAEIVAEPTMASMSSMDPSAMSEPAKSMFTQIGMMTRKLHDALRELGFDKSIEKVVAEAIPDARDRLAYVAKLTEQAADKVLSAVDLAKPLQEKLTDDSVALSQRWDKLFANQLSVDEFKALVGETRTFLQRTHSDAKQTDSVLLDIMMAQDFQDLTGQVIKKIVEMAKEMEVQLYNFLVEYTPGAAKKPEVHGQLENGPVISAEGRSDVVTDQSQVDDLLASLGF
ncbi:protein phosphatase CheZ [Leeia sp. IMCC25680]|uniref:Protein phosphatase CheZ n=2 Tax=Leeia aquatica TaxID=2725557 RepID=A0A847S6H3_9NEIS|nr:protein phosphatase CheZ [Leeia aquatica]